MRSLAKLWRHDILGVRLGVLALVLPLLTGTLVYVTQTRGLWAHPPDSRYYMTMTERNLGHNITTAIARAREVAGWRLAPWYFANNDPTWQLVKTRGLFPFLSMGPTVFWGLGPGTLVVPCLAIVAFCWVTARVLQRLYGPAVAALVVGAFSLTSTISGLIWATTDTLAMALAAVLVANLPIERRIERVNLVWLAAASVFIAVTRQVGVLAPAMAACGWVWAALRERSLRNRWLGAFVVTTLVTGGVQGILAVVANVDTEGIVARGQTTVGGVVRQFFHSLATVLHQDISYLWSSDRLLYALLIAATLMTLLRFTKDLAAVFVGAVLASYLVTAGVGYSANLRYEVAMFPAAAVAAGAFVAWALSQRGSPFALPGVPRPRGSADPAGAEGTPGTVWLPQAIGCAVCLGLLLAVSVVGGSRSTVAAPASPSFAAAQGGQPYAVRPLAQPSAETTLKVALLQADKVGKDGGGLEGPFDWVHDLRYRPTGPADPGWNRRAHDGTTITRVNAMTGSEMTAFGNAVTFNHTLDVTTLRVEDRKTSDYGQDVTFSVEDTAGVRHTGTATTLYPIWNADESGLVTSLIYEN